MEYNGVNVSHIGRYLLAILFSVTVLLLVTIVTGGDIAPAPHAREAQAPGAETLSEWKHYSDEELGFEFNYPAQYGSVDRTILPSGCWGEPNRTEIQCQQISLSFSKRTEEVPTSRFLVAFGRASEANRERGTGWPDVIFHIQSPGDILRFCEDLSEVLQDRADVLRPHCRTYTSGNGLSAAIYWQEEWSMGFDSIERYFYSYLPNDRLLGGIAWTTEGLPNESPIDKRAQAIMQMLDSLTTL